MRKAALKAEQGIQASVQAVAKETVIRTQSFVAPIITAIPGAAFFNGDYLGAPEWYLDTAVRRGSAAARFAGAEGCGTV